MASGWEEQYRTARNTAGYYPVPGRALTAVTGEDSKSFLHSMVVSDVERAEDNSWTVSAMLTPKGRMVADLALYHLPDRILIESGLDLRETVEATLRRYALRAALELRDVSQRWSMIDICGPRASSLAPETLRRGRLLALDLLDDRSILARTDQPLQPGLRWLIPAGLEPAAEDHLRSAGVERIDPAAATALRMEAGIPIFGTDVGTDNLVLEVPVYRDGVSFEKGCYIGQETVARLHSRGENIARHLRGVLTEERPEPGTALVAHGKAVGSISSTTWSPAAGRFLSLAMVHRSAMAGGTILEVGPLAGEVTTLPLQDG